MKVYTCTCRYSTCISHTFPSFHSTQNSIRHNLSIRKNMFMKVYQFPPRRGNGSYWTLLPDGEEELKNAYPLFSTLLPPVIDENSAYCRIPATHTVKSKGQFVPVLPQSNRKQPYFALQGTQTPSYEQHGDLPSSSLERGEDEKSEDWAKPGRAIPRQHLLEHSYSKLPIFDSSLQMTHIQREMMLEDKTNCSYLPSSSRTIDLENAQCYSDSSKCSVPTETNFQKEESTMTEIPPNRQLHVPTSPPTRSHHNDPSSHHPVSNSPFAAAAGGDPNDKDSSLNIIDTSFLTPMKCAMVDLALGSLSFSPLYNFVTPQREPVPQTGFAHHGCSPLPAACATTTSSSSLTSSPNLYPAPTTLSSSTQNAAPPEYNSGILSPFASSLRFSTPLMKGMSPLVDLPGDVFNTPQPQDKKVPPNKLVCRSTTTTTTTTPTRLTSSHPVMPLSLTGLTGLAHPPSTSTPVSM